MAFLALLLTIYLFGLFFALVVPLALRLIMYVVMFLAIAVRVALIFTGKGLLRAVIRVSVLSGRGIQFAALFLYFLIDEKFRGARQEEFDEEWNEEPAETVPSETDYQAALATLGLEPGVTRDVLNKAYKKMMVKVHPDMPGGSTRAAQALNTSRDLVMNWNGWT